jgi:hypothetical protein
MLALLGSAIAGGCSKPSHVDEVQSAAPFAAAVECPRTSVVPTAVPPDQGVWTDNDGTSTDRVVAMIGPAEVRAGSTAVTRIIETMESSADVAPIRSRAEAALMHIELLPRFSAAAPGGTPSQRRSGNGTEPAAAYALTPLLSLIAYEACSGAPTVRYLRRDARGGIARDVMLHRVSALQ